jgi:hypothetical protein
MLGPFFAGLLLGGMGHSFFFPPEHFEQHIVPSTTLIDQISLQHNASAIIPATAQQLADQQLQQRQQLPT